MRTRLLALTGIVLLAASLPAQAYKAQQIPTAGISIYVSSKLRRLPIRLDAMDPTLKARFGSKDKGDMIKLGSGRRARTYGWSAAVYEFTRKAPVTGQGQKPEKTDTGEKKKPSLEERVAAARARAPKSFAEYLKNLKKQKWMSAAIWITEGKGMKKRPRYLAYDLWEYHVQQGPVIWHTSMAVYRFDGREVMQLVRVPFETEQKKLKGSTKKLVSTQIKSGRQIENFTGKPSVRDAFAKTEARKKALEAAKANIVGLRGWDYFTTESYIVIYSFEGGSRLSAYAYAKKLAEALGKMRELYQRYYPPLEGMEMPYSVFRVCATYEQFTKYGSSRPNVVGWFSPVSKELVVFKGGDKMMHFKGATETVAFHEGWHQYANAYFGFELQRWFDEGTGDFFGSHALVVRNWKYQGSRMRSIFVKMMVQKENYVPWKTIIRWHKKQFYDVKKAGYYYAQAYGMIDFLRRGEAMGEGWDPRWGEILSRYREVAVATKDGDKAVDAAFDGVDFKKLEAAWKDWVLSKHFPILKLYRPKRKKK